MELDIVLPHSVHRADDFLGWNLKDYSDKELLVGVALSFQWMLVMAAGIWYAYYILEE